MYDYAHVRLVNSHSECVGSHHNPDFICLPVALSLVFYLVVKSCVIKCGYDAIFAEIICYLLCLQSVSGIYDAATFHLV